MIALVVGVALVCGLGFAAYQFVGKPILEKQKRLRTLQDEVADLDATKDQVRAKNRRLVDLYKRSLPPDVEFAKREYDSLLVRLLDESDAPRGFIIKDESSKATSAAPLPRLNPENNADKTPAYTKVAFRIEMAKTNLDVVVNFLKRYYQLNLLHQITLLEMKREGTADLGKDGRPAGERDDLKVTIVTEAIIINGTPGRRSLLPIPPSNGAVLGGAGLWAMSESPAVGRNIVPQQFEPILAYKPARDYFLMQAKDPFHGSLPPPPAPVQKKAEVVVAPPPKPDFGQFIKFISLTHTTEGDEHAARVTVYDRINNEEYEITFTRSGEKLKPVVRKFYFIGDVKKGPLRSDTLDIDNSSMINKHSFKLWGLDGNDLIVSEKKVISADAGKVSAPGGGQDRSARGPRPTLPAPDPKAAVIGGAVAVPQAVEKYYRWGNGLRLSELVELTPKEAEKAVQRAQGSLIDRAAAEVNANPMATSGR
jgi:hypothetical protein